MFMKILYTYHSHRYLQMNLNYILNTIIVDKILDRYPTSKYCITLISILKGQRKNICMDYVDKDVNYKNIVRLANILGDLSEMLVSE